MEINSRRGRSVSVALLHLAGQGTGISISAPSQGDLSSISKTDGWMLIIQSVPSQRSATTVTVTLYFVTATVTSNRRGDTVASCSENTLDGCSR